MKHGTLTYLDANASAPLIPEAKEAMILALEACGNASSVHRFGRARRNCIETVRSQLAAHFKVSSQCVTFTSGATEANASLLRPDTFEFTNGKLLIGASEHPSVMSGHAFGTDFAIIPLDDHGQVTPQATHEMVMRERAISADGQIIVSVMGANNETGIINDITAIALAAKRAGAVYVHCDATQLIGKHSFHISGTEIDYVSISAHKFGGPQGIGAIIRKHDDLPLVPLLKGGGQERNRRAGSENAAAIVGFGVAMETIANDDIAYHRMHGFRCELEECLLASHDESVIVGGKATRLCNTVCFATPGVTAQHGLIALDLAGIAVSSGSACSSGKVGESHVLKTMGLPGWIVEGAIRISLHRGTQRSDIEHFLSAWPDIVARIASNDIAI